MYETTCEVFQFGKIFWLRFTSGPETGTIRMSGYTAHMLDMQDVLGVLRTVSPQITFVESRAGQFQA